LPKTHEIIKKPYKKNLKMDQASTCTGFEATAQQDFDQLASYIGFH